MPVNMDPSKRGKFGNSEQANSKSKEERIDTHAASFGEETEEDREKALADAESKNLWDATEVIDVDPILPGSGQQG